MRRTAAAWGCLMVLLGVTPTARAQPQGLKKLDLAVEYGISGGLGTANHQGAHGWIDRAPTFTGQSFALRANRITLGVQFSTAHTDTLYTADPANGGRLLIALRPVRQITESIHDNALLFSVRAQVMKRPRTLNPYLSFALGNAKLRDRVVGDTAGTQISSVVGRRAMSVGIGLESRGFAVPYTGGLLVRGYAEAQRWTRDGSGESARLGIFYTSPYGPTNNYYQARDHYLYGLDTPPGKWTYTSVSLGVRLQYSL